MEFRVDKYELSVLELAMRNIADEAVVNYEMLNENRKFEYAGNPRRLKAAINRVCEPESETADELRDKIDRIIEEQDKAKGVAK
jgi:hypothetical protein